jgi:sugar phosphate isomerase/epimerase
MTIRFEHALWIVIRHSGFVISPSPQECAIVNAARALQTHRPMKIGIYIDIQNDSLLTPGQYDFIEENVQTLLVPESEESVFQKRLDLARSISRPVKVANRLLPADLKCVGAVVDEERLLRWGQTVFRRAEQVGVDVIVWGSGASRKVADDFPKSQAREQFLRAVSKFAPIAQQHGVMIVIEPVCRHDSNFIMSLADGADIVHSVGHPSVRLLADFWHMQVEGEPATEIARFADILEHVHLSEYDMQRSVPGVHHDDFGPYLEAIKTARYNKGMVIESILKDVTAETSLGLRSLKKQMTETGLN